VLKYVFAFTEQFFEAEIHAVLAYSVAAAETISENDSLNLVQQKDSHLNITLPSNLTNLVSNVPNCHACYHPKFLHSGSAKKTGGKVARGMAGVQMVDMVAEVSGFGDDDVRKEEVFAALRDVPGAYVPDTYAEAQAKMEDVEFGALHWKEGVVKAGRRLGEKWGPIWGPINGLLTDEAILARHVASNKAVLLRANSELGEEEAGVQATSLAVEGRWGSRKSDGGKKGGLLTDEAIFALHVESNKAVLLRANSEMSEQEAVVQATSLAVEGRWGSRQSDAGKKGGEANRYKTRDEKADPDPNLKRKAPQTRNKSNDARNSKKRSGEGGPRLMCKVCCVDLGSWQHRLRTRKDDNNPMERHLAASPRCRVTPGVKKGEVFLNFKNSSWI